MELKFDPNQQFQLDAIASVVNSFEGQPPNKSDFEISFSDFDIGMFSSLNQSELGIGNNLVLDDVKFLKNINDVQKYFDLEQSQKLHGIEITEENTKNTKTVPYLTIEMETGTGKTYVYLRTIFELNQKYGFKKFVIVVPSIAIREGVLKSIQITKKHFNTLYNNTNFDYFVYDSKKINTLRHFTTSNHIQIMIINIDAFRGGDRVISQENDKLSGRKPIEYVQATYPIVIVDEPQSVDNTIKAQEAIKKLNPLCTIRYSATHLNDYNLLYKLDAIKAYEMGLVKQIAVSSVLDENNNLSAYIKLNSVDNKNGISAKILIEENTKQGPRKKSVKVKAGDDLFQKSKQRVTYQNGYLVNEINTESNNEFIRFANGNKIKLGESFGGLTDDIRKMQIKNAIKEHLDKELRLQDKDIKVLTLFFIDQVSKYRDYDKNGNKIRCLYEQWFEDEFNRLIKTDDYKNLAIANIPVAKLHDGYFAIDNKGREKNTQGESLADEGAYNKIMKDKERLLSLEEPLRFIFTHSALREGWDNPNVFQICTLNETSSELKKRQEIGRGLRIPVNQYGERVFDTNINKLVVIANEHYEDFAKKLQTEYEQDYGIRFGRIPKNAFSNIHYIKNTKEINVGITGSEDIWQDLHTNGYIDSEGTILPKFNPNNLNFYMSLNKKYENIKEEIINIVESYKLKNHIVNYHNKKRVAIKKEVLHNKDFKALWEKINKKTRYSVEFSTQDLIKNCISRIDNMDKIEPLKIITRKGDIKIEKSGISFFETRHQISIVDHNFSYPDILTYLQKETELTRNTIFNILTGCSRLSEFKKNPQRFMDSTSQIILSELKKLLINGIKYEKIGDQEYEMRLFEKDDIVENLNSIVSVNKSIYESVVFNSEIERRFAQELDKRDDIKLFLKLPKWFTVNTPLGKYNPDWAILKKDDAVLYLVRETKGVKDFDKLRSTEALKIHCGNAHFAELGVDFKTVVSANEV